MLLIKLAMVLVGLTGPGYMLARCCRLERAGLAAFPLSALLLTETIILFALTGIPIQFGTMVGALLTAATCCQIYISLRAPEPCEIEGPKQSPPFPKGLATAILVIAAVILAIVTLRTSLYPLCGLDTMFRWEGLSRAMLEQQSLEFYPPVNAGDYAVYLFPDGIPPLVATVYWWIYATLGEPWQAATAISISLQLAVTMALTFCAARYAFEARAAWIALLVLATSPLLVSGFAIGQETGFTALSVAGQLCFAYAAVRKPRPETVVVAALFAALGALTRDYGPALALTGFAVLAWHPPARRYLWVFILTTALCTAPWYLRNWALTGNPFFSHRLPGGFSVNATHVAIIDFYKQTYSFDRFDLDRWLSLVKHLVGGGFLAIAVGLPYAACRRRDLVPLLVTTLLVTLLWIFSVAQTAGGVLYSTRVLTPAMVALAIAAGAAGSHLYRSQWAHQPILRYLTGSGMILLAAYAILSAATYPFHSTYSFAAATGLPAGSIQQVMVEKLEATDLPPTGVLTDSPFFAAELKQNSRFRPVVIWNPAVDFIFDQTIAPKEIQRHLIEQNIRLIFVDDQSTTNRFLVRHRFFRDSDNWKLLFDYPNEAAFFYFDPRE